MNGVKNIQQGVGEGERRCNDTYVGHNDDKVEM